MKPRYHRPAREDLAIDQILDIHGEQWLVSEYRATAHGFRVAMGWPVGAGPGGPRTIMSAPLAEYLLSVERVRDIDLPISLTAIKRLRAALDLHFDWDAWWTARAEDLRTMTLADFAVRHRCSTGAASQRKAMLRGSLR